MPTYDQLSSSVKSQLRRAAEAMPPDVELLAAAIMDGVEPDRLVDRQALFAHNYHFEGEKKQAYEQVANAYLAKPDLAMVIGLLALGQRPDGFDIKEVAARTRVHYRDVHALLSESLEMWAARLTPMNEATVSRGWKNTVSDCGHKIDSALSEFMDALPAAKTEDLANRFILSQASSGLEGGKRRLYTVLSHPNAGFNWRKATELTLSKAQSLEEDIEGGESNYSARNALSAIMEAMPLDKEKYGVAPAIALNEYESFSTEGTYQKTLEWARLIKDAPQEEIRKGLNSSFLHSIVTNGLRSGRDCSELFEHLAALHPNAPEVIEKTTRAYTSFEESLQKGLSPQALPNLPHAEETGSEAAPMLEKILQKRAQQAPSTDPKLKGRDP